MLDQIKAKVNEINQWLRDIMNNQTQIQILYIHSVIQLKPLPLGVSLNIEMRGDNIPEIINQLVTKQHMMKRVII